MSENSTGLARRSGRTTLLPLAAAAAVVVLIVRDPERFWNMFLVLMGFGTVIFVHELGHYVAAKSVGILVEGFSLGFGPIVVGVKKIRDGYRIRILPALIPGRTGQGILGFFIPSRSAKQGETEYSLRLIPLGGFVKMLGQEDIAADKPSDNPRAFGNKPLWQRAIAVSAGVTMNVICGAAIFIIVFAKGVHLSPAVVGDVIDGTPAAKAGLKGGDEIIAIDGKENISFMDLTIAAAFADENEPVVLAVRHEDGTVETVHLTPQLDRKRGMRVFGIAMPFTLTVADLRDPEALQ